MLPYTLDFREIDMSMIAQVGGKNASLGEMFRHLREAGVGVPDGFAVTASAYWDFLQSAGLKERLEAEMARLDRIRFTNLGEVGKAARALILSGSLPPETGNAIREGYRALLGRCAPGTTVAVRSSATAEDLPTASFAGQLESFLNVADEAALLDACRRCYASLFTDRAIEYRELNRFRHMDTAVSIGIQAMVRSDLACSGVAFSLDPDSGFRNVVVVTGSWGLGENVVQGLVTPDQFTLFKPSLRGGFRAIVGRKLGAKERTMVFAASGTGTLDRDTPPRDRERFILTDSEAEEIGRMVLRIEEHYGRPMDVEWAKDGLTGALLIVQARPETVHASRAAGTRMRRFELKAKGTVLAKGIGLGDAIAAGNARVLHSPAEADKLRDGEVLVTDITTPDWDPIMKRAAAIVTDKGGRTSHAAIVARELGITAVVGTGNATTAVPDGREITVSCAEGETGFVYAGKLPWTETDLDLGAFRMPRTRPMLILGDPERAFGLAALPNEGVGLLRLEFAIANAIRVHPVALAKWDEVRPGPDRDAIEALTRGYPDKGEYFVSKLSEAVGAIAAAFHPKDVIVRMSDFKTNEYADLLGGRQFEPIEENPMIGFRGASRYYHPLYRDGFRLECLAMKRVREEMGLRNVKLMIPFCRTVEEGEQVLATMAGFGLERGRDGLEVYVMVEIPSNVLLAESFARIFDGFSIGSNDLTQLTLGLDRDSTLVSGLFTEKNPAVKELIARAIQAAKRAGIKIGLCGQAPSDYPEYARFLVGQGIDSISFNPDALLKGIANIASAEAEGTK